MNQIKFQVNTNRPSDDETTRLRSFDQNNKLITSIENLSNELFFEIFDYFDGCVIYNTFSRLNIRFRHLICSCLLLKINLSSKSKSILRNQCWRIIYPNRQRILSLYLSNTLAIDIFFKFGTIDSSFNCLESLVLNTIDMDRVMPLLMKLTCLPRLFSMTITLCDDSLDPIDVYGLIFRLPFLKYNKISTIMRETCIALPFAISEEFSGIENLVIDHGCTLNELNIIFSYTPQLRRVSCKNLRKAYQKNNKLKLITLFNLTRILLVNCELNFDEFQIFIMTVSPNVQLLHITTSKDTAYLNPDRWEKLIRQHIPHLRKFKFQYHEFISTVFELQPYHALINRFTSKFWIEQQWFFELRIEANLWRGVSIIYSIYPVKLKTRWYELCEYNTHYSRSNEWKTSSNAVVPHQIQAVDSSFQLLQATRLTVIGTTIHGAYCEDDCAKRNQSFINQLKSSFTMMHITHLEVNFREIFLDTFIKFIHLFPHLDSLKVYCGSLKQLACLSVGDSEILNLVVKSNKITKVSLSWLKKIGHAHFLIGLFPYMEYLEMHCGNTIDPELFLQSVLSINNIKYHRQFFSLCLYVEEANTELVQNLQKMIDREKLLDDYIIKCISKEKILLCWK